MSYDFNMSWELNDLLTRIRRIENAPSVTTMAAAICGHGNSRGGGVCWRCCMDELIKRLGYDKHLLTEIKSLAKLDQYDKLRIAGINHNLAMILLFKKGPPGYCHPPASGRPTKV